MANIAKASVKSLLGMAARAEIDSNRVYSRLASKVKNPLLKEKFAILAFEEKKHEKVIKALYKELYKGQKFAVPAKTDEALLPSVRFTPSTSLAEILRQTMESEKAAQNFYAALAGRTDKDRKKILGYLSHVEKSHCMMLRSEYTLALSFEDYAEKDIDKVVT